MVIVYALASKSLNKLYIFRGDKEYTDAQIQLMLNKPTLQPLGQQQCFVPGVPHGAGGTVSNSLSRFFLPVDEVELQLTNILENLSKDPWNVAHGDRPLRCTGSALNVAALLLGSTFPQTGARIMLFSAGPGTLNPGMIVGPKLKEPIRSHSDIDKDNGKHYKKAIKFYDALAKKIVKNSHTVDILAG